MRERLRGLCEDPAFSGAADPLPEAVGDEELILSIPFIPSKHPFAHLSADSDATRPVHAVARLVDLNATGGDR